jgi:type II secretory ATPase GspE/PulE/Tfp pilus assembly ATPase PilB-like protein
LEVNEEIQELILRRGSEEELYTVARKNGFITMKEDAIFKALEHTIPFEEVNTLGGTLLEFTSGVPIDNPLTQDAENTV